MKRFSFFLPLFVLPLLTGCNGDNSPTQLTFGTYKEEEAIQLTSSEFSTHYENNENFLLAIYPKDSSCMCWRTFSTVIDAAVKEDHLLIYKYYAQDIELNSHMKELGGFNDRLDAPTFYIIKNQKIAKYYNYSNSTSFFKTKDGFLEELNKSVKLPKMFYMNEEQIDNKIKEDRSVIFFARNKCSDCNYVIPNTLVPYFDSLKEEKENIYIFDMQEYRDGDEATYQAIKDKYLLSTTTNPELGFEQGVVPTFQVYEKGVLKDMSVYVNEGTLTYSDADSCYYASNAYYNEARNSKLHYLDNVEVKDLTKVKITKEETIEYKNNYYWDISYSSQYYDPILKGFLDKYL